MIMTMKSFAYLRCVLHSAIDLCTFWLLVALPSPLLAASYDYGDAPDPPYPTLNASDGARHAIVPGVYLGVSIDAESDAWPDSNAKGDDTHGIDDEDGVVFVTALVPGLTCALEVTASTNGFLQGWIDFNGDGDWKDAGEWIFKSTGLTTGVNRLTFTVPSDSHLGPTYARFRFSTDTKIDFFGEAPDGEVEDYRVQIQRLDWGDCPDQPGVPPESRVTHPAADDWDRFGDAVAISGHWALIGAYGVGPGTYGTGAAYFYKWDGASWNYVQTVSGSDTVEDDTFGTALALDGNRALIGAPRHNPATSTDEAGAVYFFEWNGSNWVERQKLTSGDADRLDRFGTAVSLSGDRAVIGAKWDRPSGFPTGAAYVFEFDGTSWTERQKLTASDGEDDDNFGIATALWSNWIAVSATGVDTPEVPSAGAVYLYELDGVHWVERQKLGPPEAQPETWFARSVAIDAGRLLVGAHAEDHHGLIRAGAAYLYELDGTSWGLRQKLVAQDPTRAAVFGWDVDLAGDYALVGAYGDGSPPEQSGAAYLFFWNGTGWTTKQKFVIPGSTNANQFGWAVAVAPAHALVGAPETTDEGRTNTGVAYVFNRQPDKPDYHTLMENDGARHVIVDGVRLGASVDMEADGQPHSAALGDDLDGNNDDDGVTLTSAMHPGRMATCRVVASAPGILNAWIDFNGDSDWNDPYEQIFVNELLSAGVNNLSFFVAPDAIPADQSAPAFARFRFSTEKNLQPWGEAPDGEVEDYALTVEALPEFVDFGDAPDIEGPRSYPTRLANNGAWHEIKGPWLGQHVDAEPDGQSSIGADGDDADGLDDEDGVYFNSTVLRGNTLSILIDMQSSTSNGYVNGWIDYSLDGDWDDPGEQVITNLWIAAGNQAVVDVAVPADALAGRSYARFRVCSSPGLGPTGPAPDGEVEDYLIDILQTEPENKIEITNITVDRDREQALVEWNAEPGVVYQVQSITDLMAGSWTWRNVGGLVVGPVREQTDADAVETAKFYRVMAPHTSE